MQSANFPVPLESIAVFADIPFVALPYRINIRVVKVSSCPTFPKETAKNLCFGRLDAATTQRFRRRLKTCTKCRKIYEDSVAALKVMREAETTIDQRETAVGLPVVKFRYRLL